jgi:NitT/TauT family transport system permease protein
VSRPHRWILAGIGFVAAMLVWHATVSFTRPAPVRPTTLAFSSFIDHHATGVVLDGKGRMVARRSFDIGPAGGDDEVRELTRWLRLFQPTVAALPVESANHSVRLFLDTAKNAFGGALEITELGGTAERPDDDALRRARAKQQASQFSPAWLPGPWEAVRALAKLVATGEMLKHLIASLFRVTTGFLIALALGIPFGLALGSFASVNALTSSLIQCLRSISPIAWLPVATLMLGGGDLAAICLIFLSSFFPVAISTAAAVGTVDLRFKRAALNFGFNGLAMARRVLLPAALPAILTAVRVALGISWMVVVAAEMLGVESGLGYLILDARNQLRYDRVVAAMIVIGLIGLLIDIGLRRFEHDELARRGLLRR